MELSPSMVVEVAANSAAGFGLRLAARLIDLLFGVLVVSIGSAAGTLIIHALESRGYVLGVGGTTVQWMSPAGLAWSLPGALLYFVTSEAVGGATLGKLLLRLRVTSENLTPSTFKGALLRTAALCIDVLGVPAYLSMSRTLMSQRYGDRWGHTVVLRASAVPPDSRKGMGLLLLGVISGCTLWGLCITLFMVIQAL
jgi:uncharacterized RDD family membrane protein YckC